MMITYSVSYNSATIMVSSIKINQLNPNLSFFLKQVA